MEGFVIEDSNDCMFKLKLSFYRMWKYARSLKEKIIKGKKINLNTIDYKKELTPFLQWMLTLEKRELKSDIITLR